MIDTVWGNPLLSREALVTLLVLVEEKLKQEGLTEEEVAHLVKTWNTLDAALNNTEYGMAKGFSLTPLM